MNSRDRLIELIQSAVDGCARHWAEKIADYLIDHGAIIPPCKVGDTVYQTDNDHFRIYKSKIKRVIYDTDNIAFDERAIGKTVFLDKKQVETIIAREQSRLEGERRTLDLWHSLMAETGGLRKP